MSEPRNRAKLFILRRQSGGPGGAEKVVTRFARMFGATREVVALSAGHGVDAGVSGPGWWRALRFAFACDRAVRPGAGDIVFTMERGPRADIYRAGDGTHRRWLEIAYAGSLSRWVNPLHHVYPYLEHRTLAATPFIVANSEMGRRDIERFNPEAVGKVRVIRNAVDLARFRPRPDAERAELRRSLLPEAGDARIVVFAGSGWKRKGLARAIRLLADTAKHLDGERADLRLVVLGKGRPEEVADTLDAAGMRDRTHFAGAVSNVHDWLAIADLFLLPTAYDPCSNACLEALAAGCPVVTTENNGAAEAIRPGETGLILPGRETAEDATRLAGFLTTPQPSPAAIAATMADYSLARETADYERLFAEILRHRRA